MTTGDERFLTLSIGVRVSPEPVAIELLHRYRDALNYAIKKISMSIGLSSILYAVSQDFLKIL